MARSFGNAFSAGMLEGSSTVRFEFLDLEAARAWALAAPFVSCFGHSDTAELVSAMLGVKVETNRVSTALRSGDQLMVAQYNGPRLPEGAISLPEGAKVRFILAIVE